MAATIRNWSAVEEAMKNMAGSMGSADREMEIIENSLDFRLNRLKETGVGIAQNLFQRDDMKGVVDFATAFLEIIDKITEKIGLFGTIGAGAGIFAFIKNLSQLL